MPTLGKNFKQGDLIYGFKQQRRDAAKYIDKGDLLPAEIDLEYNIIDNYNDIANAAVLKSQGDYDGFNKWVVKEFDSDFKKNSPTGWLPSHYFATVKGSRYSLWNESGATKVLNDKGAAEFIYYSRKAGEKKDVLEMRNIRWLCKAGIVCIEQLGEGSEEGRAIHFILDGIKMEEVTRKSDVTLITHSELRAAYRNWHKVSNNVKFYRSNIGNLLTQVLECPPPWIEPLDDAMCWKSYGLSVFDKFRERVGKMIEKSKSGDQAAKALAEAIENLYGNVIDLDSERNLIDSDLPRFLRATDSLRSLFESYGEDRYEID